MHRIKKKLNKLISNTILIVQLHQLKTQTVPVHIKNIDLNINNTRLSIGKFDDLE